MARRVWVGVAFGLALACADVHGAPDAPVPDGGTDAPSPRDAPAHAPSMDAAVVLDAAVLLDAGETLDALDAPPILESCDGDDDDGDARIDEGCTCTDEGIVELREHAAFTRAAPRLLATTDGVVAGFETLVGAVGGIELVFFASDRSVAGRTTLVARGAPGAWGDLALAFRDGAIAVTSTESAAGRYLELAGTTVLGPLPAPPDAPGGALVSTPTGYAATGPAASGGLELRLVAPGGATTTSRVVGSGVVRATAVSLGDTTIGVAYEVAVDGAASDVVFQAFTLDGAPSGAAIAMEDVPYAALRPAIVGDASGFFVSWLEETATPRIARFRLVHVDHAGVVDVGPLELGSSIYFEPADAPSLALDDDDGLGVLLALRDDIEGIPLLTFLWLGRDGERRGERSRDWTQSQARGLVFDREARRFAAGYHEVTLVSSRSGVWFPCSFEAPAP